jgi:hypothetical protein
MRSDLVFGAMTHLPNRYLLCQVASKAARKLHRPGSRMQDTANDVLVRFSRANPIGSERALRKPLMVPLHPHRTPPVFPHKSEVVTLPPASERSSASWEAARALGA